MLIQIDGRDSLLLGVQTNPGNFTNTMHFKAIRWAPSRARSYSLIDIEHTDYHGRSTDQETGYGRFVVKYYSRMDEGVYLISKEN